MPGDASETNTVSSYRILVRDLVLPWQIGVWRHEENRQQRIRLNLELQVSELPDPAADKYDDVLCYEKVINEIRALAVRGHVKLAETLADQVAALCLADPRALQVTVRIEKLEAIEEAASVGVEITRFCQDKIRAADTSPLRLARKD
jgi:dihydroneopterin aldolase